MVAGYHWFRGALVAILLLGAAPAGAAALILRSTGPSAGLYRPGQRLADDGRIVLRHGDSVTILRRGRTHTLRGRGIFRLDNLPRGPAVGTGPTPHVDTVLPARPPDFRFIDTARSGVGCLWPGNAGLVWREDVRTVARVRVTRVDGAVTTLPWAAGMATLPMPTGLTAGARIQIAFADGRTANIVLAAIDFALSVNDLEPAANALLERNCAGQLDTLIAMRPAEAQN